MEAGEIRSVTPPEHRQNGGHGAPAGSQNGAGRQDQDALPGRFGEEGGERPAHQDRRDGQHLQLFRADNRCRAGASPWPDPVRCSSVSKPSTAAAACAAPPTGTRSTANGRVARLKPTGEDDKVRVLAWHREKSGPFSVPTMTLDRALDYVASNPFFWIHA